jgi:hypothetical protein
VCDKRFNVHNLTTCIETARIGGGKWTHAVHTLEKIAETIAGEPVINVEASLLAGDHSGGAQDEEVLGDGGHIVSDEFAEFTHAAFALQEGFCDTQARWVGKSLEHGDAFFCG